MRLSLLNILRAPITGERLVVDIIEAGKSTSQTDPEVIQGTLTASKSKTIYPIIAGVPVMLPAKAGNQVPSVNGEADSHHVSGNKRSSKASVDPWSFSDEWREHFNHRETKTWGWTTEERLEQFYLETLTDAEACKGKVILDAGCGNGQLSEHLGALGATVVGLDYSTSVFTAERNRQRANVHFVRGDLESPPFVEGAFDIIVSNGVLHHTRSTQNTFSEVAKLTKAGGKFYVWLYRRPESFSKRHLIWPAIDCVRGVTSRMPGVLQSCFVKGYALVLWFGHQLLGKYQGERYRSWGERVVGAYDTLTPRWKHYHTPLEVCHWFFVNGFAPPVLTHWDNSVGFGMVATKNPQRDTPGMNFGKSEIIQRFST